MCIDSGLFFYIPTLLQYVIYRTEFRENTSKAKGNDFICAPDH